MRVDEKDARAGELDAALSAVFAAADRPPKIPLTYFEAITAAAFVLFRDARVELAILEVGLGGRLDATNVAPASLSVVTSIAMDHMSDLGDSLPAIAREKAGIFRRGRPALFRAEDPEALAVLAEEARRAGAELHDASTEIAVRSVSADLQGTQFDLETPLLRARLRTPLPGAHQAWNAALAVRAAELLPAAVGDLSPAIVSRGLSRVRWAGRLERLATASGRSVLLDGCHNPEGARALAAFLEDAGLAGRAPLVFGAMSDKDVEGIAAALFPKVSEVMLVRAAGARAAAPGELLARVGSLARHTRTAPDLAAALALLDGAGPSADPAPIIVAGSLYLVGEARAVLRGNEK